MSNLSQFSLKVKRVKLPHSPKKVSVTKACGLPPKINTTTKHPPCTRFTHPPTISHLFITNTSTLPSDSTISLPNLPHSSVLPSPRLVPTRILGSTYHQRLIKSTNHHPLPKPNTKPQLAFQFFLTPPLTSEH